jgi:hypothetical protein
MNDKNYVKMEFYFARMSDRDTQGIFQLKSNGFPDNLEISSSGDCWVIPEGRTYDRSDMLAFCSELKQLCDKYFPVGEMPSLN